MPVYNRISERNTYISVKILRVSPSLNTSTEAYGMPSSSDKSFPSPLSADVLVKKHSGGDS
ncbi:7010_t:CDS:2 [Cetraspora pellucida]|uniref:7010_t:CDS:1 n=1 Tax=Cetraspora pellucida TaxID=1433469 RepID=A0A9N9F8N4_9GLOM|nr:7010_t:CDS:2 [Cetraspora pellucida]